MKISLLKFNNLSKMFYPKQRSIQQSGYNNFFLPALKNLEQDTVEISFNSRRIRKNQGANETTKEKKCSTNDFQIKKIKNLRCPVCGKIMLKQEQIDVFANDIGQKKGKKLIEALKKYENEVFLHTGTSSKKNRSLYRPIEQEAVNIIKHLAKIYPDKDLSELFQIQKNDSIRRLRNVQLSILDEYTSYAINISENNEQKKEIKELAARYTDEINNKKGAKRFSRADFVKDTKQVFHDKKAQNEINKIVQKMPTSKNSVDAFFVKYSTLQQDSTETAKSFFENSIHTTEHIQTKASAGADVISNYIADCASCNRQRGNTSFSDWIKTVPHFKENLQDYLEDIQKALDNNTLDESYKTYIPSVIETIKRHSGNKIFLSLTDSKNPVTKEEINEQRKIQLENFKEKLNMLKAQKKELDDIYKKIKESEYGKQAVDYKNSKIVIAKNIERIKNEEVKIEELEKAKTQITSKKERQNINRAISSMKNRIKLFKARNMTIEKKVAQFKNDWSSSKIDIEEHELLKKIAVIEKFIQQMIEYDKFAGIKESTNLQYSELKAMLQKARVENEKISEKKDFNKEERTNYLEYLHYLDLAKKANEMKNSRNKNQDELANEIVDVALKIINEKIENMESQDSVKYFMNEKFINDNQKKYERLNETLIKIQKNEEKIRMYASTLKMKPDLNTLKSASQKMSEQREVLLSLKNFDLLLEQRENLNKKIKYNSEIYLRLKNYEQLTNKDFKMLIEQISI